MKTKFLTVLFTCCVLFDAKNISYGPICTLPLPQQICSGTHATWAQMNELVR